MKFVFDICLFYRFTVSPQRTEPTRHDGRPQSHVRQNHGRRSQPYVGARDFLAFVRVRVVHITEKRS